MAEQKATPVSMMLKRAECWQQGGKIYQAIDLYFRLVRDFPETNEASKAEEQLLTLAQELEQGAKTHMALDIYERLATPPVALKVVLSPMGRPL